jgi:hypothetical protein
MITFHFETEVFKGYVKKSKDNCKENGGFERVLEK